MKIKIKNKNYLVGGRWKSVTFNDSVSKYVKSIRKRFYYLLVAESIDIQYLALYDDPSASGCYCLPACLNKLVDDHSFIFIHKINDNKYYYCIFKDGAIDPNSDIVVTDDVLENKITSEINIRPSLKNVYSINLDESMKSRLFNASFFTIANWKSLGRNFKIQDTNKSSESLKNKILIAFMLTVVGFIGYDYYSKHKESMPEPVKKAINKPPTEKQIRDFYQKKLVQKLDFYYKSSSVLPLVESCSHVSGFLIEKVGGWVRNLIKCTAIDFETKYTRNKYGSLSEPFLNKIGSLGEVTFTQSIPVVATIKNKFVDIPLRDIEIKSVDDLVGVNSNIFDIVLNISDTYKVQYKQPTKIVLPDDEIDGYAVSNPLKTFNVGAFTLTNISINELNAILDRFELDHLFFKHMIKKESGDYYEVTFEFITP